MIDKNCEITYKSSNGSRFIHVNDSFISIKFLFFLLVNYFLPVLTTITRQCTR